MPTIRFTQSIYGKLQSLTVDKHNIDLQVPEFQQPNYTENFIQCSLDAGLGDKKHGATLVIGGDGRFLCPETASLIIQIAAANGVCGVLHNLKQEGTL